MPSGFCSSVDTLNCGRALFFLIQVSEHFEIGVKEEGLPEAVPWPYDGSERREVERLTRATQAACLNVARAVLRVLVRHVHFLENSDDQAETPIVFILAAC